MEISVSYLSVSEIENAGTELYAGSDWLLQIIYSRYHMGEVDTSFECTLDAQINR